MMNRARSGYGSEPYGDNNYVGGSGGHDRISSLSRTIDALEQKLAGMSAQEGYGSGRSRYEPAPPPVQPPYANPSHAAQQASELENLKATIARLTDQINTRIPPSPPQASYPDPFMNSGYHSQAASNPPQNQFTAFAAEAAQRKNMLNNQAAQAQANHFVAQQAEQARRMAQQQGQNVNAMKALSAKLDLLHQDVAGLKYAVSTAPKPEVHKAEIERIANGIRDLQKSPKIDDQAFDRLQDELTELRTSMQQELRNTVHNEIAPAIQASLSNSVRQDSWEGGYTDLANRLDQISSGLERINAGGGSVAADTVTPKVELLASQIDYLRSSVDDLPQTLAIGRLENRLHELAKAVEVMAQQDANRPSSAGSDTDALMAIENRLDEISRGLVAVSGTNPEQAIMDLSGLERLEGRMSDLTGLVESLVPKREDRELAEARASHELDQLATRMEGRISELKQAMETMGGSMMANTNSSGRDTAELDQLATRMEARINELKHTMESLAGAGAAGGASGQEIEQISALVDSRISELKQAVEQIPGTREAQELAEARTAHEFDQLATRMETRIGELQKSMDQLSDIRGAGEIEQLSARIEGLTDRLGSFEKYAESGELGAASAIFTASDNSAIESQLQQLAMRLDEAVAANSGSAQVANLEAQVGELARSLQNTASPTVDFSPMEARLSQIESQLTVNHDFTLQAAQHAAESVMAMMGPQSPDGEAVGALSGDLKALQTALEGTEHRTADTFDAVHQTLQTVVDRLGTIEDSINGRSGQFHESAVFTPGEATGNDYARQAQVNAPSIDPSAHMDAGLARTEPPAGLDNDQPLEPGTNLPDIEEIAKQASERVRQQPQNQKAAPKADSGGVDFVAAVRRAVKATQADTDAMRAEVRANSKDRSTRKKPNSSLIERFRNGDRKPVIVAAAAAILLMVAVGGVSVVGKNILFGDTTQEARVISDTPFSNEGMETSPAETAADESVPSVVDDATDPARVVALDEPKEADQVPVTPVQTTSVQSTPADRLADPAPQQIVVDDNLTKPEEGTVLANAEPVIATPNVPATEVPGVNPSPGAGDEAPAPAATFDIPVEIQPAALSAAAAGGDRIALYEVAARYSEGRAVKRDMKAAANWFEKSADLGYAPAQYSLGSLYEKGIGVERDLDKAALLYEKAAKKGNARAMHNLAVINAMGNGRAADLASATRWFHDAANLGVKDSQFNLGILYGQGMGVPQNLINSYKWFAIAAKTGDGDAAAKRDEVANVMDPKDLEKAKALVNDWKRGDLVERVNAVSIPDEWRSQASAKTAINDDKTLVKDGRTLIKKVQAMLNTAGYDVGTPDGLIGPKTTRAVMEFQKKANLPVNGRIDPALVKKLQGTNT